MNKQKCFRILAVFIALLILLSGCQSAASQQADQDLGASAPVLTYPQGDAPMSVYPIDLKFTECSLLSVLVSSEGFSSELPSLTPSTGALTKDPDNGSINGSNAPDATAGPTENGSDSQAEASEATDSTSPASIIGKSAEMEADTEASDNISFSTNVGDITSAVVFRYLQRNTGSEKTNTYRIQVRWDFRGEIMLFTGTMTGTKIVLDNAEETDANAAAVTEALQQQLNWIPCAQAGTYAIDQELVQCTVSGLTVLYANEDMSVLQTQTYSEDGILLYAACLPQNSVLPFTGTSVFWSHELNPVLSNKLADHTVLQSASLVQLLSQGNVSTIVLVSVIGLLLVLVILLYLLPYKVYAGVKKAMTQKGMDIAKQVLAIKSVGTLHNIGRRSGQQDSFDVVNCPAGTLAVVADGMGGLADGDKVSQKIVATLRSDAARICPGQTDKILCQMVAHANQVVNQMLGPAKQYKCGSTLLSVLVERDTMQWISVGDSRIYLYRGGNLIQVNREHIHCVDLLTRAINGKLNFSEALRDPQGDRLSSFIGMGELKYVDIGLRRMKLCAGDRILLMSDGVFNTLCNDEIAEVIRSTPDASSAAALLEQRVLNKQVPHQDNFTCVILEV